MQGEEKRGYALKLTYASRGIYKSHERRKMSERKVYILADGGHDYSDATRFGTLHFLHIPSHAKWDIARLHDELSEGLKEANKDDLLVISHLTSHCCVATALLIEWFGRVNFLIFRKDKYEEKKLITDPNIEED